MHKAIPFVHVKTISDPTGRFIIVMGHIYDTKVTLVNVYAPNWEDESFFRQVFSMLPDLFLYSLILSGDFNCWIDPSPDRSSTCPIARSESAEVILSFMKEFNVVDPWRFYNPGIRKFSFFSHVHHSFSRIDFFLVDKKLLTSISDCTYDPIVLSDHTAVSLNIYFQKFTSTRPSWRLDTHLLLDKDFVNFVSQQLDFFFRVNKTPDVTASVLWGTMKAFIRGEIISYKAHQKKLRKQKLTAI